MDAPHLSPSALNRFLGCEHRTYLDILHRRGELDAEPRPPRMELLFYCDELERLQGRRPAHMHLILGDGERPALRPDDFAAYGDVIVERYDVAPLGDEPSDDGVLVPIAALEQERHVWRQAEPTHLAAALEDVEIRAVLAREEAVQRAGRERPSILDLPCGRHRLRPPTNRRGPVHAR